MVKAAIRHIVLFRLHEGLNAGQPEVREVLSGPLCTGHM